MMRNLQRALRSEDRDQGITLVELSIAMFIAGLIAVMVAATTIQAFRIQRETTLRETDSTAASLAMEQMSRDVRQAVAPQLPDGSSVPSFVVATPQKVSLISWVGDDPVKVTYTVNNKVLTRTVQQPDAPGQGATSKFTGSGATTTATLSRAVTSTALFTYTLSDDAQTTNGTFTSAADLGAIHLVSINLTVDSDPSSKLPGTTLQNSVTCLNL